MDTSDHTKESWSRSAESSCVAIIGAGPAGTAAAIRCAMAGLSVVLLERAEFPRHRPGETLHPGVEPLLRQLGVWEQVEQAGFVRHSGIRVSVPGQESPQTIEFGADASGPWLGIQAWRADFDQILLRRAISLGVRTLQPCDVKEILVDNGAVIGVELNEGRIQAEFTIDAAGGRHWLAKKLQIPMTIESPRLVARYGYFEGDDASTRDIPMLTADTDGWTWIARVRERTYQWTRLGKSAASRDKKDPCLSPPQGPLTTDGARIAALGADVTWRCATVPAGAGYFLCGDAAAVLDPASSHGVLKGLMSGIYAGHLIEQIQLGLKSESAAAVEYSDWMLRWFQHDVVELRKHYSGMGLAELVGGDGTPRRDSNVDQEAQAGNMNLRIVEEVAVKDD